MTPTAGTTTKISRFIASCMLCLLLSVSMPNGSPIKFAHASSIRNSSRGLPSFVPPNHNNDIPILTLTNTTNSPAANATSLAPTPATPTPPPTLYPTKKYESPEDEKTEEEEKEGVKIGMVFLWIVVAFGGIWLLCYFRDAILFFFGNAYSNTRRYGCMGCLRSFFPCVFGYQSSGISEPLDQIIFETEDPNAPLMS